MNNDVQDNQKSLYRFHRYLSNDNEMPSKELRLALTCPGFNVTGVQCKDFQSAHTVAVREVIEGSVVVRVNDNSVENSVIKVIAVVYYDGVSSFDID
jgi:hypothetical protein